MSKHLTFCRLEDAEDEALSLTGADGVKRFIYWIPDGKGFRVVKCKRSRIKRFFVTERSGDGTRVFLFRVSPTGTEYIRNCRRLQLIGVN